MILSLIPTSAKDIPSINTSTFSSKVITFLLRYDSNKWRACFSTVHDEDNIGNTHDSTEQGAKRNYAVAGQKGVAATGKFKYLLILCFRSFIYLFALFQNFKRWVSKYVYKNPTHNKEPLY